LNFQIITEEQAGRVLVRHPLTRRRSCPRKSRR
jgi:hypothetical protein